MHIQLATWRFRAHTCNPAVVDEQIDDFGFHVQLEVWKTSGMTGEEIQKIPLGHESDEFAARG